MNALARLGMVSESPSENPAMSTVSPEPQKDYYVEKDGVKYAGMHLIIDLWGASNLDQPGTDSTKHCATALLPPVPPSCTTTSTISNQMAACRA